MIDCPYRVAPNEKLVQLVSLREGTWNVLLVTSKKWGYLKPKLEWDQRLFHHEWRQSSTRMGRGKDKSKRSHCNQFVNVKASFAGHRVTSIATPHIIASSGIVWPPVSSCFFFEPDTMSSILSSITAVWNPNAFLLKPLPFDPCTPPPPVQWGASDSYLDGSLVNLQLDSERLPNLEFVHVCQFARLSIHAPRALPAGVLGPERRQEPNNVSAAVLRQGLWNDLQRKAF